MRFYREQHREKARIYRKLYYEKNKEYYKTLYESNKPKRLDTNRYNYSRITEQRPDLYIARIRKNNARAILRRLARKLSYNYTLQEFFDGWKYLIIRKVVKGVVVDSD